MLLVSISEGIDAHRTFREQFNVEVQTIDGWIERVWITAVLDLSLWQTPGRTASSEEGSTEDRGKSSIPLSVVLALIRMERPLMLKSITPGVSKLYATPT